MKSNSIIENQNTSKKETPEQIASKIAKWFVQAFFNVIGEEAFLSWSSHNKYDRVYVKEKIYVSLRHKKHFHVFHVLRDDDWGYIQVDLNDDSVKDNEDNNSFRQFLRDTIYHEVLYHFQELN